MRRPSPNGGGDQADSTVPTKPSTLSAHPTGESDAPQSDEQVEEDEVPGDDGGFFDFLD